MITSVTITHPKDWLLKNKPPKNGKNDVEHGWMGRLDKASNFIYSLCLPSLANKTFSFKPGLNIIVGKNGCGKTSLLDLIRKVTFCEKENFSKYDHFKLSGAVDDGVFQCCKVKADYNKSTFALRLSSDLSENEVMDDALNLLQYYEDNHSSSGQSQFKALNQMVGLFLKNGKNDKKENIRDFHNQVKKHLKDRIAYEPKDRPSQNQYVLDYFRDNQEDSKCYTFLVDEPDRGLDVSYLTEVYKFLRDCDKVDWGQIIVVLHNVSLIQKFRKRENVNWIELSEGYLDAVDRFMAE